MNALPNVSDELILLLGELADGQLTEAGQVKLLHLLKDDPAARTYYLDFMEVHAWLQWKNFKEGDSGPQPVAGDQCAETDESQIPNQQIQNPPPPVSIILDPSPFSPQPSPFYTTHPFLFSNIFASLVLSVGILGAWLYQIDIPQQIARESRSAVSKDQNAADHLEFVGQVTGMIDVRWADVQTATVNRANVPLGRKFAMASGLMEITYDTGVKVILEGPCTYKVDAREGGFLAVGKLTARLDNAKLQAATQKSVVGNQKTSLSPIPYPLFAIKTPTATVTDLGTEFGVEVQGSGVTFAHVYRGAVHVQAGTPDHPAGEPIRLVADESAEVKIVGVEQAPVVLRVSGKQPTFVRDGRFSRLAKEQQSKPLERWQNYAAEIRRDPSLVVHYDFQRRNDSPNVLHGITKNSNAPLNGVIEGAKWTTGRMPGKDALEFDGNLSRVKISIPGELKQTTIATWVAILYVNDSYCSCCLLADDWADNNCQGALQVTPDGQIQFGATVHSAFGTPAVLPWQERGLNRWRHVAVVTDPSHQYGACYLDGKKVFEGEVPKDYSARFQAAHIGNWWGLNGKFERGLVGRMDEMVILARPMSEVEIMAMYEAGRR